MSFELRKRSRLPSRRGTAPAAGAAASRPSGSESRPEELRRSWALGAAGGRPGVPAARCPPWLEPRAPLAVSAARHRPRRNASLARAVLLATLVFAAGERAWPQVSGVVLDVASSEPIGGALVTLQATETRTVSGADGSFALPEAAGGDLVIVGARKGYFNASVRASSPASGVKIYLARVPPDDDPDYQFVPPVACGSCHPDQLAEWMDSPMARAGTNTWVYDLFNGTGTPGGAGGFVYTRDSVHASHRPESECASCHQPEPWIEEPFRALEEIDSLSAGALHGVSCEVCHKLAHIDEARKNYPGIYPGVVTITRPRGPELHQVQYGLLGDVDYTLPAVMRASYQPQLAAAACAACHQDKNDPDEDGEFEEENGVISEPTYLEWLEGPYGDPESPLYATCVDCHMPAAGTTQICTVLDPPLERDPQKIRHHRIEAHLDHAVEMALESTVTPSRIEVEVSVVNSGAGHHVPTGVTIRNLVLLVDAWREEDGMPLPPLGTQVVHELGGVGDPARGYYAGLPGKLYAKVNHGAGGEGPVFFTEATGIRFDSRIPPLETDTTSYSFAVPPGGGTMRVRARLIYRRAFRFLVDAKGWTQDGHGRPLEDIQPPHFGHLMAEVDEVVEAEGPVFVRGDCNGDGRIRGQVTDAVFLLRYNFMGTAAPPCLAACDLDGDGRVRGQVGDAIYLLRFNFQGTAPPVPPYPECGPGLAETDGPLGCNTPPPGCK